MSIGRWLAEIKSDGRLSPATAVELHRKLRSGDANARESLIRSVLPFVVVIARKFENYSTLTLDDLVGEGNLHAIRAIDTWDPERGSLSGHVHRCVTNGLVLSLASQGHAGIYLPNSALAEIRNDKVGDSVHQRERLARARRSRALLSLDAPLPGTKDRRIDVPARMGEPFFLDDASIQARMARAMRKHLSERERVILERSCGLGAYKRKMEPEVLAEEYGMTRKEVVELNWKSLRTLRAAHRRRCANCQLTFTIAREDQKYCSPKCGDKDRRRHRGSKIVWKKCRGCGRFFNADYRSRIQYCNDDCRMLTRQRRHAGCGNA